MRDIKFRAWDKVCECYLGASFEIHSIGCVSYKGAWIPRSVDIEQFTGLLDSNGVEIYEGDIILSEHDGSVVVEWSERAAKFGVHVLRHHTYSIEKKPKLRAIPRDGIVIGNVHQNSELLK
jgi:hypothetical protein